MSASAQKLSDLIKTELSLLWAAHDAVGLKGEMCLYTPTEQVPFRNKEPGIVFWFGKNDSDAAVETIFEHYNGGKLPNSSLLLNPIVHEKQKDGSYKPLGSGFAWANGLTLGVDTLKDESARRISQLGAFCSTYHRGDNKRAGLKIIAFLDKAQAALKDEQTVKGCKELYDIADIPAPAYAPYYLLSGVAYLSNNGLFEHPDVMELLPENEDIKNAPAFIKDAAINVSKLTNAAQCWDAYERHHSLYEKFGTDPDDIAHNLQFFNLVARDVQLFDATGPMRKDADDMFEFIVPGLIPRGCVTIIAGSGGTGKSSIAHQLAVMTATDYEKDEEAPLWLGQRVAIEKCEGITIYFSGEDGPPIINARASIFDPQGKARRLMFQRTDFGEGVSFSDHMKRLHKIPNVPLVIIDPARKFLVGDEDDAEVVSDFFEAAEEFAIQKNAAVVLVHHLQKSAKPESAAEIVDLLRGSQVFIDRPRVVIGLYRDGPHTIMGLAKNNIPPNFGMVMEERVFAREPETLSLLWLPGDEGIRGGTLSREELDKLAEEARKEGRQS